MLTKLIVSSFRVVIEIVLWISLVSFCITGYYGSGWIGLDGVEGAIAGAIVWFFFAVFVGAIPLLLYDIRQRVKNIEESKNR